MSASTLPASGRLDFIRLVTASFEEARVEYVVLHAYDERSAGRDSDLDVAVSRDSLSTVDVLVRTGRFGRLLQRFDYDVPWCRYYVLESCEPGRRYRQLDVACDPWGIGRYGRAVSVALAHAQRDAGFLRPSPAAETYYLVVKRARKDPASRQGHAALQASFERDPAGSTRVLQAELGALGSALAAELAGGGDLTELLRSVDEAVARRRRTGSQIARRMAYSAVRATRRVTRPTGLVVCLTGPDGAGKSTLAAGLETAALGAFRQCVRLHSRPGLLPPPGQLLGRPVRDTTEPHGRPPSGTVGSLARLSYLALDYVLGWPTRVWKPRVRSSLVILERGWLDLAVDPKRYRLSLPNGIASRLGKALPKPDLTLVLDAPPGQVTARKRELEPLEVARQRAVWRTLANEQRPRASLVDAAMPSSHVLEEALGAVNEKLAARHTDFGGASIALECVGAHDSKGEPFVFVRIAGRARWLLPARLGAPGPLRRQLYRPARLQHRAAAISIDLAHSLGRGFGAALPLDPELGIAPAISDVLGTGALDVGGVSVSRDASSRLMVMLQRHGKVFAFAKIDREVQGIETEQRVLETLAQLAPSTFVAPRVLGALRWHGLGVLVTEPLALSERADRPLSKRELAALAELANLQVDFAGLDGGDRSFASHGDFTPWNSGRTKNGALAIWDWEHAHRGHPLEDYFHWHTQRLVLFSVGTVADLVGRALRPDRELRALCSNLPVDVAEAPLWLRTYLGHSAVSLRPESAGARIRIRALERLDEAGA